MFLNSKETIFQYATKLIHGDDSMVINSNILIIQNAPYRYLKPFLTPRHASTEQLFLLLYAIQGAIYNCYTSYSDLLTELYSPRPLCILAY